MRNQKNIFSKLRRCFAVGGRSVRYTTVSGKLISDTDRDFAFSGLTTTSPATKRVSSLTSARWFSSPSAEAGAAPFVNVVLPSGVVRKVHSTSSRGSVVVRSASVLTSTDSAAESG
jgi:hypothetical protein